MKSSVISALVAAAITGWIAQAAAQIVVRPPLRRDPAAQRSPNMGPMSGVERRSYVFKETGEQMPYAVFVSSKVRKNRPGPLIIALHALGGQPGMIIGQIREQAEKRGYIVVAPMGYSPRGGFGAFPNGIGGPADQRLNELSERDVMNVLNLALQQYNVDERRIYLLGHSMGGGGALHLGIKYSALWAAVGATAPAPGSNDPAQLESVRHLPFIIVHGDADPAVPVASSRRWAAKLGDLDMTYEYRELRGGGHEDAIIQGAKHVFDFFDKHPKSRQ